MGIKLFEENPTIKPRGIIRLGFKDEGDRGKLHNTEHFILKDAPDVEEVYGENPAELDIVFPSNNIDQVAPSHYELWKGTRDREGNMKGSCTCRGTGPSQDGTPGTAVWYDREALPPAEEIIGKRNPATGHLSRVCYGDGARGECRPCIHLKDMKGNPQCKLTLRMLVFLPRVSMREFYLLTTHSYHSLKDILSQLYIFQRMGIPINNRVFTLYKETQAANPWSEQQQRAYKTIINVVKMRENKQFMTKYGDEVLKRIESNARGDIAAVLPSADQVASLPPPAYEDEVLNEPTLTPKNIAEELLADPEVSDAFELLESLKGAKFSVKSKLIAIRKKEGEPDLKAAVLSQLYKSIQDERAAAESAKEPQEVEPVLNAQEQTPIELEPVVAPEANDTFNTIPGASSGE